VGEVGDVYQEIVEKYADRVVPSTTQPRGRRRHAASDYKSVTMSVRNGSQVAVRGLAMYRARYERRRRRCASRRGWNDAAALSRVTQLYFPTDAASSRACG
jgi:hypothetical protein